jgi:predicted SprT family Zn-dependent metalloprotease
MLRRPNGLYSPGCCNDLNKTIYIDENVSDFYLRKILSHELVHACMYSYNIELSEE